MQLKSINQSIIFGGNLKCTFGDSIPDHGPVGNPSTHIVSKIWRDLRAKVPCVTDLSPTRFTPQLINVDRFGESKIKDEETKLTSDYNFGVWFTLISYNSGRVYLKPNTLACRKRPDCLSTVYRLTSDWTSDRCNSTNQWAYGHNSEEISLLSVGFSRILKGEGSSSEGRCKLCLYVASRWGLFSLSRWFSFTTSNLLLIYVPSPLELSFLHNYLCLYACLSKTASSVGRLLKHLCKDSLGKLQHILSNHWLHYRHIGISLVNSAYNSAVSRIPLVNVAYNSTVSCISLVNSAYNSAVSCIPLEYSANNSEDSCIPLVNFTYNSAISCISLVNSAYNSAVSSILLVHTTYNSAVSCIPLVNSAYNCAISYTQLVNVAYNCAVSYIPLVHSVYNSADSCILLVNSAYNSAVSYIPLMHSAYNNAVSGIPLMHFACNNAVSCIPLVHSAHNSAVTCIKLLNSWMIFCETTTTTSPISSIGSKNCLLWLAHCILNIAGIILLSCQLRLTTYLTNN